MEKQPIDIQQYLTNRDREANLFQEPYLVEVSHLPQEPIPLRDNVEPVISEAVITEVVYFNQKIDNRRGFIFPNGERIMMSAEDYASIPRDIDRESLLYSYYAKKED
jgi:hypothetical protein